MRTGNFLGKKDKLSLSGRRLFIFLFVLHLIAGAAYLHRVPGLFGDEASEGYNVYELWQSDTIVVRGERSYIGPLVDYARLPFVMAWGYSALSLRLLMLLISAATFVLAAAVFKRLFGDKDYLWVLALMFFSPAYLLYQRLGWTITLFPFFAFLLLFFLTDKRLKISHRSALAGLAAGLGLHNYLAWLPTLAAVMAPWLLAFIFAPAEKRIPPLARLEKRLRALARYWLFLLGFWAGFGTQFAVMQLRQADQGDPARVIAQFPERLAALPRVLPLVLSGSSYMARYTGREMSEAVIGMIISVLVFLVVTAFLSSKHREMSLLWLTGLAVQLLALTFIIDRFTLRYFVVFVLGFWVLAGVGLAVLAGRLRSGSVAAAVLLAAWTAYSVLLPYLSSGGSTERFSLGNRTDTAADFVDIRPLVSCAEDSGPVWSANPHIYNRLLYLSRGNKKIEVPASKYEAHWLVQYRQGGDPPGAVCQGLRHFKLLKRK